MSDVDRALEILQLDRTASKSEVKDAYRGLVMIWHPDIYPNNSQLRLKADQQMKEINLAYETLHDYSPQSKSDAPAEGVGDDPIVSGSVTYSAWQATEPTTPGDHWDLYIERLVRIIERLVRIIERPERIRRLVYLALIIYIALVVVITNVVYAG